MENLKLVLKENKNSIRALTEKNHKNGLWIEHNF
jgi:hypothetical protein